MVKRNVAGVMSQCVILWPRKDRPQPYVSRGYLPLNRREARRPIEPNSRKVRSPVKDMDREVTALFQQWLVAFENTQSAEEAVAALARIESCIAAAPAEGLRGLVVKLGLQRFMHEHADASSELAASVYADLMRLTGYDPSSEILARLRS